MTDSEGAVIYNNLISDWRKMGLNDSQIVQGLKLILIGKYDKREFTESEVRKNFEKML